MLDSRPARAALLALLGCLAIALAAPAFAAAETFVVDTAEDRVDENRGDGDCETEFENCSLRAAIEEVNTGGQTANEIDFDNSVFDGEESDNIFLGSQLEPISVPTIITGGQCMTAGISPGPCAGVSGTGTDPVFVVGADDSLISGISVTNGSIGIYVTGESTSFIAIGNWIGMAMSGSNFSNGTGVFIGPGSDDALIGGTELSERNVIAHNPVGLDIEGASDATVQGNWFGRLQSGGDPAAAGKNIEITDSTAPGEADKAEDNEIGATISGDALTSSECDGGCNVILGSSGTGVDLVGDGGFEAPATGPTEIHGNYIGLDGAGTEVRPNDEVGVEVGTADDVTIGAGELGDAGPEGFADANFFAGGEEGVTHQNGDDLKVIGNSFGIGGDGSTVTPPSEVGISTSKSSLTVPGEFTEVSGNTLRMGEESFGIEHHDYGAVIRDNTVESGGVGIRLDGSIWGGSLVAGNEISATEDEGILITNKDNAIYGNEVSGAGEAGIEVQASVASISGNVIGGNTAAEENAIFDSGANAIVISGVAESRNQVRRNHGSGNGGEGGFLVLRGDDPNGAEPPDILVAAKAEASGDEALPGARVRVFFKESAEEGELGGFLGEAIANPSGEWKVSYAAVPGETMITATQTNTEGGTSSLSEIATTPPDPPPCTVNCGGGGGGGGSQPPPAPPAPDTTKPKVTIKKAPKAKSTSTTAKFVFVSDEAGSKFKCKLDNKAFANCSSPKTYKKLKPGKHVFKVKATDAAGNVSAVVTRRFTVLE